MPNVSMVVIPEPPKGSRAVMLSERPQTFFTFNNGDVNLLCGSCGFVLAQGLSSANQIQGNMVLRCGACGSFNESRF
jgi:hypothetical protein